MPAYAAQRQSEPSAWFSTPDGLVLLAAERARVAALLAMRAAAPTLWLCPAGGFDGEQAPAPVLVLHTQGRARLGGCASCRPSALPLADASLAAVIVQHLADVDAPVLLAECARVLRPGGHLWLFTLNPFSPYRLRWHCDGLQPCRVGQWRGRLRQAGLECVGLPEYLGPVWHHGWPAVLRAAMLLCAHRCGPGRIPTLVRPRAWSPTVVPDALAGGLSRALVRKPTLLKT